MATAGRGADESRRRPPIRICTITITTRLPGGIGRGEHPMTLETESGAGDPNGAWRPSGASAGPGAATGERRGCTTARRVPRRTSTLVLRRPDDAADRERPPDCRQHRASQTALRRAGTTVLIAGIGGGGDDAIT